MEMFDCRLCGSDVGAFIMHSSFFLRGVAFQGSMSVVYKEMPLFKGKLCTASSAKDVLAGVQKKIVDAQSLSARFPSPASPSVLSGALAAKTKDAVALPYPT